VRNPAPQGVGFVLRGPARHPGGARGPNPHTPARAPPAPRPHFHTRSTELFHVLEGVMWFDVDGRTTTVTAGGLVSVPPGVPHSFGAVPDSTAELLSVLAPGVDRFEYFRTLGRVQYGQEAFDDLLQHQERYDVHFLPDPLTVSAPLPHLPHLPDLPHPR
ncbi:cupin domain-containing protein, partial [Streptomyces sp. NPDC059810]|uniref:cupin domain-containing protein n=1 Tax=Streptomyces sp. NPDC059810 TaxID=3346956 RepID=UPI003657F08F